MGTTNLPDEETQRGQSHVGKADKKLIAILRRSASSVSYGLKLSCLNLSSDLVHSIALRKAIDTDVTVCLMMWFGIG